VQVAGTCTCSTISWQASVFSQEMLCRQMQNIVAHLYVRTAAVAHQFWGNTESTVVGKHLRCILQCISRLQCLNILSFTSWLVVGVHRQSCHSSTFDPLNVTPCTHLVRIPCAVNAISDTRSPIIVSFDPRASRMQWIPTTNQNVNESTWMDSPEMIKQHVPGLASCGIVHD
jgi:hypothetical protein